MKENNFLRLTIMSVLILSVILLEGCSLVSQKINQPVDDTTHCTQEIPFRSLSEVIIKDDLLVLDQTGTIFRVGNTGVIETKNSEITRKFMGIWFLSFEKGWAATREGDVWSTSDSGINWKQIGWLRNSRIQEDYIRQIYFCDEKRGYILGGEYLWKTVDGGTRWTPLKVGQVTSGQMDAMSHNISVIDCHSIFASGFNGNLHLSNNQGETWNSYRIPIDPFVAFGQEVQTVFFLDKNKGYISTMPFGSIYSTTDGGKNWRRLLEVNQRGELILSIYFTDALTGWIAGEKAWETETHPSWAERKGLLLTTKDGGKSWKNLTLPEECSLIKKALFINNNEGWVIERKKIYFTANGGESFRLVATLN
jgi:photosystem II stability/assembly factor-like uncharacterized protein